MELAKEIKMPRFKKNKKKINPRWFLNENSEYFQKSMGVDNRDEAIEAILDFESEVYGRKVSDLEDLVDLSDEELAQKYASITDTEDYRNMIAKMDSGLDSVKEPEDEYEALPKQVGMGRGRRMESSLEDLTNEAEKQKSEKEEDKKKDEDARINTMYYGSPHHPNNSRSGIKEEEKYRGVTPLKADSLVKAAVSAHNNKGGRKILPGELEKIKAWARKNVVGDREVDAKNKISDKIK